MLARPLLLLVLTFTNCQPVTPRGGLTAVVIVMVAAQIRQGVTQKDGVTTCRKIATYLIKRCNLRQFAVAPCSMHQFFVAYSQLGVGPRH